MKSLFTDLRPIFAIAIAASLILPLHGEENDILTDSKPADLWEESIKAETEGDYFKAMELIYAYRKTGGDEYCAAVRAGWLSWLRKDYEKALEFYKSASKIIPTAITPLLGIANVCWVKGDYQSAERAIDLLLRYSPGNYTALITRGRLHYEQYDYRNALRDFSEAHRRYPEDASSASWAAWSAFYKADFRQSKKYFEKVLALDSDYPLAQNGLQLAQR